MKAWLENLSQRERMLVLGGGAVAIVLLFYFLVWSPFTNAINDKKVTLQTTQSLLAWMKPATQRVLQLRQTQTKTQKVDAGSLLTTIDGSLKKSALARFPAQIDQTDNNKVRVQFKSVSFDDLVTWLMQIDKRYHIAVQQINVVDTAAIGIVQAQITLGL